MVSTVPDLAEGVRCFKPLTPLLAKNAFFWTFWRFSGWIWAKLAPIYPKMYLQHESMLFFPLALRFYDIFAQARAEIKIFVFRLFVFFLI